MKLIIELLIIFIFLVIFIIFLESLKENDKYKILLMKIDKSKLKIKKYSKEKYEIIFKIIELLHKQTKIDESELEEFLNINLNNENDDLYEIITNTEKTIMKYFEENEKLINNKDIKELLIDNYNNDIKLNSTILYYNDNVKEYNSLTKKGLAKKIAKLKKYNIKNEIK